MRFGNQKKKELEEKLLALYTQLFLEAKQKSNLELLADESVWYKRVFDANLVSDPKQLFLLGALADAVHNIAPRAMKDTMEKMGLLKPVPHPKKEEDNE